MLRNFIQIIIIWNVSLAVLADEITVGVASNFLAPMQEIATAFEAETGNTVNLASGSSGRLYAQIANGAPYHAFFSADQDKPALLIEAGLADTDSLFTYATGSLVLWMQKEDGDPYEVLMDNRISRLAIANPRLAPYGMAATQVIDILFVGETSCAELVLGENINQAYQFVMTGNADAGFIALSQLAANDELPRGRGWIVPPNLYDPIRQDAVLVNRGMGNQTAIEFLDYVKNEAVRNIIKRFGYIAD